MSQKIKVSGRVGAVAAVLALGLVSLAAGGVADALPVDDHPDSLESRDHSAAQSRDADQADRQSGSEVDVLANESAVATPPGSRGSALGRLVQRAATQLGGITPAGAPASAVYDDPGHADVDTFIDEETGEEYVLRSGVTHWEESDPDAPQLMSRALAAYSDVFKVSGPEMVAGAPVSDLGQTTLRIDLDIPSTASVGDQYTLSLRSPLYWQARTIQNREIKDASGKVFAVLDSGREWSGNEGAFETVTITLTDAVEEHAEIQGFVEVRYYAASGKAAGTAMVDVFSPDGVALGPGILTGTLRQVTSSGFSHSNGALVDNRPALTTAVNIREDQMRVPFVFTVAPHTAGVTAVGCESASVVYQGFDSNGLWATRSLDVANLQCVLNLDGSMRVTLATMPVNNTGLSDGQFRISVRYMADAPGTDYLVTMTTNLPSSVNPLMGSWSGNILSGTPVGAGADHLSLVTKKSASFTTQNGDAKPTVGDTITYTITTTPAATNDRAIKNLVTLDRLPAGLEFVSATNGGKYNAGSREIVWGPRILTSTGKFTDTVKAKITAVPSSGLIKNTVENVGEEVCTDGDSVSVCDSSVTTLVAKPGFEFTKSSTLEDTNKNGYLGDLGDTIVYSFAVKNIGETTLTTAKLTDDLLDLKDVECLADGTTVKPGASATCKGTFKHVITQKDVDAGQVANHATLCVDPAYGLACKPGETTNKVIDPSFTFEKHSEVVLQDEDRGFDGAIAGDEISYWFTVSNTGNVALKNVTIDDDMLGLKGAACVSALPVGGKDVKCETTKSYTITEGDQEAGEVLNAAIGKVPGLPDEPSEVIDPTVDPAFAFDKSVVEIKDPAGKVVAGGKAAEGDVIHFGFSAENTGDVDITSLLVSDPMLGVKDIQCLPEGFVLEVGKGVDCVDNAAYEYVVTAADVKAGKVHNVATGMVPGLPELPGETTTPVLPTPVVTELPKTGAGGTWLIVGAGSLMLLGGAYAIVRNRRKVGDSHEMAA